MAAFACRMGVAWFGPSGLKQNLKGGSPMKHFRFTDSSLRALPAPATSLALYYDQDVPGLCFRITRSGARAFALRYRTSGGRERYFTIGRFSMKVGDGEWGTGAARKEAAKLKE